MSQLRDTVKAVIDEMCESGEAITVEPIDLTIKAGDTLVLRHEAAITTQQMDHIREMMAKLIPGVKTIVLTGGLRVEGVLRG